MHKLPRVVKCETQTWLCVSGLSPERLTLCCTTARADLQVSDREGVTLHVI